MTKQAHPGSCACGGLASYAGIDVFRPFLPDGALGTRAGQLLLMLEQCSKALIGVE